MTACAAALVAGVAIGVLFGWSMTRVAGMRWRRMATELRQSHGCLMPYRCTVCSWHDAETGWKP